MASEMTHTDITHHPCLWNPGTISQANPFILIIVFAIFPNSNFLSFPSSTSPHISPSFILSLSSLLPCPLQPSSLSPHLPWASRDWSAILLCILHGLFLFIMGSRKATGKVAANAPRQLPMAGLWRLISFLINVFPLSSVRSVPSWYRAARIL